MTTAARTEAQRMLSNLVEQWRAEAKRLQDGTPYFHDGENSVRALVLEQCADELELQSLAPSGWQPMRSCTCFNKRDRDLCLHKAACVLIEAHAAAPTPPAESSEVSHD